jgi:LacI family transcriptional regulator
VAHIPPDGAATAAVRYLHAHPEVTAAFCCNDAVALELIQAAPLAGIDVPGRLSVVGYDDIDLARFVSPPLTTMAVDKLGMGRLAVTLLLFRMEFGQAALTQAFIRPRLVERGSVRDIGTPAARAAVQVRSEAMISER